MFNVNYGDDEAVADTIISICHGVAWKLFPSCSGVNDNGIGRGTRSPGAL